MKYSFYLSIVFILGFMLTSADSFACGKKSPIVENSCCKSKSGNDKKSCCKKSVLKDNTKNHSCDGSCKDLSCQDFSAITGILVPSFSLVSSENLFVEKVNFFDTATQIAVGFHSLLLRPKIG